MAIPAQYTFSASDSQAICLFQTTGAAGALTINGTLLDQNAVAVGVRRAYMTGAWGRVASLTSTGNLNGINFTIAGRDVYGSTVTETRAGPNNGTVATTQEYAVVTSVTADAAVSTNCAVGIGTTGSTRPFTASTQITPANFALYGIVTNTITWSVQDTPTNIEALISGGGSPSSISWLNHPTLSSATGSGSSNYAFPVRYIRGVVNSSTSNATCQLTITQAGLT